MEKLIKKLHRLKEERFTGSVTLAFHKGDLSKMIKVETTEDTEVERKVGSKSSGIGILNRKDK